MSRTSPEYEQKLADAKLAEKRAKSTAASLANVNSDNPSESEQIAEPAHLFDEDGNPQEIVEEPAPMETPAEKTVKTPVKTTADSATDASTPEMENSNLAFTDIPMPKMIQINKMLLSPADIANAEHVLCMNGIREIDAHNVLAKVMVALTGTNID